MSKKDIHCLYISSNWTVEFTRRAQKQFAKLNCRVKAALRLLVEDLIHNGPFPGMGWPNYGKLKGASREDKRHCHLIKGKPTYICCWAVIDKNEKIIEVYYVGTHEKAPY